MGIKAFLGLTIYISPLDKFLDGYRNQHPRLSASQSAEKQKYDQIFAKRDNPVQSVVPPSFWDKF